MIAMQKNRRLVIFGSQEMAQLARFYFEQDSRYSVAAFTVDDDYVKSKEFDGLPLVPWSEVGRLFPPGDFDMFVALSYRGLNRLRADKFAQAKTAGYCLASYLCSKSVSWPDLVVGENCLVLENQTVQRQSYRPWHADRGPRLSCVPRGRIRPLPHRGADICRCQCHLPRFP